MKNLSRSERIAKIATTTISIVLGIAIVTFIVLAAIEQVGREAGVVHLF